MKGRVRLPPAPWGCSSAGMSVTTHAPMVKWISHVPPKDGVQVRFLLGVPSSQISDGVTVAQEPLKLRVLVRTQIGEPHLLKDEDAKGAETMGFGTDRRSRVSEIEGLYAPSSA